MTRPRILVCNGSRCRRALARDPGLLEQLERLDVRVTRVGCQKVCEGPVVGIAIDDDWEWFGRVASPKALRALAALIEEGTLAKPLRKRQAHERSGKRRA